MRRIRRDGRQAARPCVRVVGLVAAAILVLHAASASAQTGARSVGLRAFVSSDTTQMTASRTFDAVLGSSRLGSVSGGGEVVGLWNGLFLRVAASRTTRAGERAVVFEGQGYRVGIRQEVRLAPLELGAGWRVEPGGRGGLAFYGGAGLMRLHYQESSPLGSSADDVDRTLNGSLVFGGVDYTFFRLLMAGAEAQFRTVPNGLGAGGVSKAVGESDLGGMTLRALAGIRW